MKKNYKKYTNESCNIDDTKKVKNFNKIFLIGHVYWYESAGNIEC